MPLFIPNLILKDVTHITPNLLKKHNIRALILDVDNTLTMHGSQNVEQSVIDWLCIMKQTGIKLMLLSNNSHDRIKPFAKRLELPFVAMGMKPMTHGFTKATAHFSLTEGVVAVVGDQIYTDVLGGNLKGMFTILVAPFQTEQQFFFKVKRALERSHIKRYYKNNTNDEVLK